MIGHGVRRTVAGGKVALTLLAVQGLALLAYATDAPATVRAPLLLGYLGVVPGLALVRSIELDDPLHVVMLGIGTSIAMGTAVAQGLVWGEAWSPGLCLLVLAAVTTVALAVQAARDVKSHVI